MSMDSIAKHKQCSRPLFAKYAASKASIFPQQARVLHRETLKLLHEIPLSLARSIHYTNVPAGNMIFLLDPAFEVLRCRKRCLFSHRD